MAGDCGFILSQKSGVCGDAEIYASNKGLKLVPTLTGFPAKVDIFDLKGRVKNELDTCSCVKSVLAPSTFNIPTGYVKVESEEAVVASHQQGLLQDMSEDLGVKFGSHK